MSLPMLQTSPSVNLQVGSDRQLRADVVRSANPTNALRSSGDGLYAKRGTRSNFWSLTQTVGTPLVITTQLNQIIPFGNEVYDPDGLVDLVAFPTRVTIPTAGRYNVYASCIAVLTGGSATSMVAQWFLLKNGVSAVAGSCSAVQAAGNTTGYANLAAHVDLAAGDYLELVWRWLAFGTLTGTAATATAYWQGWRLGA